MKTRLSEAWSTIAESLWFVPTIMAIGSVGLAIAMLWLDAELDVNWSASRGVIYAGGVSGGRELLSTIAGSIMTVTGVIFSVTMVTLSLASNQYGPRLLRNFMSDRANQLVLGTFIGTFIYCLLVLRTLRDSQDITIVPAVSISFSVVLALVSLGMLIYFIHHISDSIQASSILSGVGHELDRAIERVYPEAIGRGPNEPDRPSSTEIGDAYGSPPQPITFNNAGYVRAVDPSGLMQAARDHDAIIRLDCRPGGFVFQGSRIGVVWSRGDLNDDLVDRIRGSIIVGKQRTAFQDLEFLMSQLIQPALLALSPGVNNSLVAITAIDWVGATFAKLASRQPLSDYRYDDGKLRVITESVTFSSLFDSAFDPLRESARANTIVSLHLMDAIIALSGHVTTDPQRITLLRQAELIAQDSRDSIANEYDRSRIHARYHTILGLLGSGSPQPTTVD